MSLCRVCLCLIGITTAGCESTTSIKVSIDAPGLSLQSLEIAVGWDGKTQQTTKLPPGGGVPALPGSVLLVLPDMDKLVDVEVQAVDDGGLTLTRSSSVQSHSHQQTSLALTLSQPMPDFAFAQDLSQPDDLAGADFAGLDLSSNADLSSNDLQPSPDLGPHNPLVQLGTMTTGGSTLTVTLPKASRAGTLLVFAGAWNYGNNPTPPASWGWWQGDSLYNNASLFYLTNNPGGITSVSATLPKPSPSPSPVASVGLVAELDTFTATDVGVWCWDSNQASSFPCTTTTTTTHDGELALEVVSETLSPSGTCTFSPSANITTLADNGASTTPLHLQFGYQLSLQNGMPASATMSSSKTGTWAGVVVTFH
jgi:hypothetical protein